MKSKVKREFIEWVLIICVIGVIYLGGWHTVIIGKIQQVVLSTGIISPNVVEDEKQASYNFVLEDINGERVDFNSFKNRVVFINFWATWCPPCIAEMPDIHQLYQAQKDQVAFIMISLDKDEIKAKKYVADKEFKFPVYFLRSSLPEGYNIQSIPTTYVIDKGGLIRVENHGMAKYNTKDFKALLMDLNRDELID
ncbi:TlpA family protein disulfide reductase [Ekhidna sp.]|uniref:TlpA family protein disulfide reductase n=1 Tax=Ekhidna sp. TaxID=2608089 RepID=UPI003B507ACD